MKRNIITISSILLIVIFVSIFVFFNKNLNKNDLVVGTDKDIHGCIGSAGYSWCEVKNKCLRVWEEKCGSGSPLDATYNIDNKNVTLIGGKSEVSIIPDSAVKIKTNIFGEPVVSDLNNDGIEDYVMFITQDYTGGSGTFYYVVAGMVNKVGNIFGTNAVLLGDRIAPQNINIKDGKIIVNYADRKVKEPMSNKPSVGVSRYFIVENNELKEIENLALKENNCLKNKGVWYSDNNTCEINSFTETRCIVEGGEFNGCASACRHDPKAEVCTMQCVLTCTFR